MNLSIFKGPKYTNSRWRISSQIFSIANKIELYKSKKEQLKLGKVQGKKI